ncbi:hypothetical protein Ancab_026509 [Ancistrocladus abbreviatus]
MLLYCCGDPSSIICWYKRILSVSNNPNTSAELIKETVVHIFGHLGYRFHLAYLLRLSFLIILLLLRTICMLNHPWILFYFSMVEFQVTNVGGSVGVVCSL